MHLPIGISDFRKLIEYTSSISGEGYLFVDKSLFIREILDDLTEVIVITRPRRFGKTLNLSMLQHFFASEVDGKPTAGLFDGLAIAKDPACMQYQGKYPVIFISFKDAKYKNFALCYEHIRGKMAELYGDFKEFVFANNISSENKKYFEDILNKTADVTDLDNSLFWLTKILYTITGNQCIILIDEYDTPIQEAYLHGYYDELMSFIRVFFGSALKGNSNIKQAVLTGILRIAKESLFSDLNNVEVYSILHEKYSNYFGFTEKEVNNLLTVAKLPDTTKQSKEWYNGYNFGGTTVYNPWSIIKFIKEKGKLKAYWVNTSGNRMIKDLIINSPSAIQEKLQQLISGEAITEFVDEHVVFTNILQNNTALWSLLLMAGYLTFTTQEIEGQYYLCNLAIPNKEVANFFKITIEEWLAGTKGLTWYQAFLADLADGRVEAFEAKLQVLIEDILSCRDVTKSSQESFYHGLMLAFVSGLKETHEIRSNKESGKGFYDVAIIPKDIKKLGIVMEFKAIAEDPNLESAAQEALKQINKSNYIAELKQRGITNICCMGIAFSGRKVKIIFQ